MRGKRFKSLSIGAVIFILGVATGFWLLLLVVENFSFSKDINISLDPVNLATLLVTVFLAIYVTRRLERMNEQERVQKNLILKDLESFKDALIQETTLILSTEKISYTLVVAKLKNLRLNLNSLIKLIKKYEFVENSEALEKLDEKIRDIKDLLTDTPSAPTVGTPEISVNNGEISFGSLRREAIEAAISEMKNYIFELAVEINKK